MNKPMIIVSGLPRSGTSMMMKMLEAGGVDVLVDNIRKADEDNPKGYYEFEKVKGLKEDHGWLDGAGGKVVKMVSKLLQDLPPDRQYKVIFMRRHMEEIIKSQNKMLQRKGKEKQGDDEVIAELFTKHLAEIEAWITAQDYLDCIYVSYNEMLETPEEHIAQIVQFLGRTLDKAAMKAVIDGSLYRQKKREL